MKLFGYIGFLPLALFLSSCGSDDFLAVGTASVGGSVSGNSGPVTLTINRESTVTIATGGGPFEFGGIEKGTIYSVEVSSLPDGQGCEVSNSSGTIDSDINNISVTCSDNLTGKRFFSSASAGEVVDFDFDFDPTVLEYTWETTKSSYGALDEAENVWSGSGTLVSDGGNRYRMFDSNGDPFGRLTVNEDEESMIARVALPILNGGFRAFSDDESLTFGNDDFLSNKVTVPVFGVADKIEDATAAGVYNFVSTSCRPGPGIPLSRGFPAQTKAGVIWNTLTNDPDEAMCTTSFGTVSLSQSDASSDVAPIMDVTYCERANIGGESPSCTGGTKSGTATLDGDVGAWLISMNDEPGRVHALIVYEASDGQNVGWLDTDGGDDFGYGTMILSEQVDSLDPADIQGTYHMETNLFNGNDVTLCASGANIIPLKAGEPQGTFLSNSPWVGMAALQEAGEGEILGMLAGLGMLVTRNPVFDDPWTFEIGQKTGEAVCGS
jgi:hypothetical protein